MVVTPLGVDLDLFRPIPVERADAEFRVLFVGQIGQRKGLSYLLDAARASTIPELRLQLLGAPVGSTERWSPLPFVDHLAHRPRWELPAAYAQADVFVLPSLIEGFPQTALEAMACGLPVIVSEHTFGDDVVEHGKNGYVVPIRDPDAIAECLRALHGNPKLRHEMGAAARRRAEDFGWERYKAQVGSELEDLTQ
jgi:glycosyltransferase involved in cell wall biosynthesis